jgi:hypothetical protein
MPGTPETTQPDTTQPDTTQPRKPRTPATASAKRRRLWLGFSIALAIVAGLIGQFGFQRVTSVADQPITFVVEDGLPYGITQERVEAAAEIHGAVSRNPFTVMVVERDLDWDEYANGELPEGVDLILSVGYDVDDPDLSLPSRNRIGIAGEEDKYSEATAVRESLMNNLTMGHGPSAVVGAARTAAVTLFDGASRSPLLWGSLAALPLLVSLFFLLGALREARNERLRRSRFMRARLQLARVVLEHDTLEVRYAVAHEALADARGRAARREAQAARKKLDRDWKTVRNESLELARLEQALERELINPAAPVHSSVPTSGVELADFERRVEKLRRRADSLAAAASVRVGHANSDGVLARLALPISQATGEILRERDRLPGRTVERLETQRRALLALVRESEVEARDEPGAHAVKEQADLLRRWRDIEGNLCATLDRLANSLPSGGMGPGAIVADARDRARKRIRANTSGETDTTAELRNSLGLASFEDGALVSAEIVLSRLGRSAASAPERDGGTSRLAFGLGGVMFVAPIVIGLVVGGIAANAASERPGRNLVLEGDKPISSLQVFGDTDLDIDTVNFDYVRENMADLADFSDDLALLPEDLDVTVSVLPVDDYFGELEFDAEWESYEIPYDRLLEGYELLFADIAAEYPEVFSDATGEVALGQAILPLWTFGDGSYAVGMPLTGEISWGPESDLGAYYFNATELRPWNPADDDSPLTVGDRVVHELLQLGRQLEHNKLEAAEEDAQGIFWAVAFAVWTAIQAVLVVAAAISNFWRQRRGSSAARRQLEGVRSRLEGLALGLDLSRLDMVAVLGAGEGETGDAAAAEQRLYETALLTAWRQAQALESLPRNLQRGPEWVAQVEGLERLVKSLAARDADVSERALEVIRAGD